MKVTLFSVAPGERKRECVRPDYEENECVQLTVYSIHEQLTPVADPEAADFRGDFPSIDKRHDRAPLFNHSNLYPNQTSTTGLCGDALVMVVCTPLIAVEMDCGHSTPHTLCNANK